MDKKTTLEMIAAISNANGTSGFEDEVVAAIRPYAEGLGEITEDRMRNLYIRRKEMASVRLFSLTHIATRLVLWCRLSARTELSASFRSEVGLTTIFRLIKSWFATGSENIFRGLLPASLRIS